MKLSEFHSVQARACDSLARGHHPETPLWHAYLRQAAHHALISHYFELEEDQELTIQVLIREELDRQQQDDRDYWTRQQVPGAPS
jgi:hypothetical protein